MTRVVDMNGGAYSIGGGGPQGPSIDERVRALEAQLQDTNRLINIIKTDTEVMKSGIPQLATEAKLVTEVQIERISGKIDLIKTKVSDVDKIVQEELKQIRARIPTGFQIVTIIATLLTLSFALNNFGAGLSHITNSPSAMTTSPSAAGPK